ncbi:hypothetical protein ABPG77_001880 [Micractinium sp. CCAP 211/92]
MMQSEARLILRYFGALPKQVGKGASKSTASTAVAPAAVAKAPALAARAAAAGAAPAGLSGTNPSRGASGFHMTAAGSTAAKQQSLSFAASAL